LEAGQLFIACKQVRDGRLSFDLGEFET
jgi:hypothetical protein